MIAPLCGRRPVSLVSDILPSPRTIIGFPFQGEAKVYRDLILLFGNAANTGAKTEDSPCSVERHLSFLSREFLVATGI